MAETPQTTMYEEPSALCTLDKAPIILTGIFRQLLIRHFSTADNIKEERLKSFVWKSDKKDTGIVIEANTHADWQLVEYRPAIIIRRDSLDAVKLAIDDMSYGPAGPGDGVHYIRGRAGSHTLFCICQNGALVEILAAEITDELTQFAPLIRRDMSFSRFEEARIGPVMAIEESNTHFAVPVNFAYSYTARHKLSPETPWFKTFSGSVE